MNEAQLRDLCETMIEILRRFPDRRFGQLVCNLTSSAGGTMRVWDVEDEALLASASRFLDLHKDRIPAVTAPELVSSTA